MKDNSLATSTRLKLLWPDGQKELVYSITSNEEHAANLVAEGELEEAQRWEHVAKMYAAQYSAFRKETLRKNAARQAEEQAKEYAAGWVRRWLEDTAANA